MFSPRSPRSEKKSPCEALARSPCVANHFLLLTIAEDSPHEALRSLRATDQDQESNVGSLGSLFSSPSSSISLD
ncbi:hypothetical protein BHE74_00004800 [Ensete ventricosum]|nr:hypothetical protein BHE74_00004800 [Ensete ventricosum]